VRLVPADADPGGGLVIYGMGGIGKSTLAAQIAARAGRLTRSGAAELATALPAIGLLGAAERDHAYRLTAGHPLAMAAPRSPRRRPAV
jgi:hypothetical protein